MQRIKCTQWIAALTVFIGGWILAGCNNSDHRISAQTFIQESKDARAVDLAELTPEEAEDLRGLIDEQLGPFVTGPGDVISVTVSGPDPAPLLPAVQVRVDRNGEIFLPMVGKVDVAAMELEDVEKAIHKAFVPAFMRDASVFVDLLREGTTEVLVRGAVQAPGLVPLRRTQRNLLFAIVLAGGVSDMASGRVILRRIRNPAEEFVVDLTNPAGMRDALAQAPLERGDIVLVESAPPNTIFVQGLVYNSRPQQYSQGVKVTVLQALAAAGGLRDDLTPREATLIRHMPDGTDRHVKLDLDKIRSGQDENLLLAAGDILNVPHSLETRAQDFINRNFFFRAGVSVNYSITGEEYMNRQDQQSGSSGDNLQDQFDPFGFLSQNQSLNSLVNRPTSP